MTTLKNKVVWLTGASSGIGEALALRLARTGCRLVISARRAEALEFIAANCRGGALVVPLDVTDKAAVQAAAATIRERLGPVDVLITSAGTYIPTDVDTFNADEYARIMNLNYTGTLHCVEAVLPDMIARRSGHLVPISSLVGYRGAPRSWSYGASKAALINFFEGLRFDLEKYCIRVTIVNPGFVKTPLTDKNDFPMPFLVDAETSARHIVEGIARNRMEVHYPWQLSWIFKLLRVLPYPLYHRLIAAKVVRK